MYGRKTESIYDKDHIHQSENISISQDFIKCVFCSLHFLAKNMFQKYTKIRKFTKYLDTQKNLTLKFFLNVYKSTRRMYSINYYHKNKGSPAELSQERGLTIEIRENGKKKKASMAFMSISS